MYTVVTGLFDIGRGQWQHYRRPIEHYLFFFSNLLRIKAPIIVFCEERFVEFVKTQRLNSSFETTVIPTPIEELYMYKYKDLLFEIQADPNYAKDHPHRECPEISTPMYTLVTVSKPDLVRRAIPYAKTDYLIWLDAGYTHGTIDIGSLNWNPTSIINQKGKISLTILRPLSVMKSHDPVKFSNQYVDIVSGGFFGGHKDTIELITPKYYDIVHQQLTELRLKDDDQHYWLFLILQHPELFNLLNGTWFSSLSLT
jgi:protein YibB